MLGGTPDELQRALLVAAGWLVNLAVAEWIIRFSEPRGHLVACFRQIGHELA